MEILRVLSSNSFTVGTDDGLMISFQESQIHNHMVMLKLQRHTISIKIQESRKLKYKDNDFRNSEVQDLPQRF
ncbi:hypothetical protein Tco_1508691 [Tanacetum coccineum]